MSDPHQTTGSPSVEPLIRRFALALEADLEARGVSARQAIGLSANEWTALVRLITAGRMYATELANRTGLATATITSLVDRLAAEGLIDRDADTADRRRRLLTPTAQAKTLVEQVFKEHIALLDQSLAALDSLQDRDAVRRFLNTACAELESLRPVGEGVAARPRQQDGSPRL